MKSDTEKGYRESKKLKWLKEILLLIGMLVFSAGIVFLLNEMQDVFKISLQRYGWLAFILLFLASMLSSATIFIPAPGIAFMLAAAVIWNPIPVALAAGSGDAVGEMTSYWAGYAGKKIMLVDENLSAYQRAVLWMNKYGVWAIFAVALVPVILFDLIGLAAGALKMRWWKFLLPALAGKVMRALLIAYLGHQIPFFISHFVR
jgi:membrane protein YqaA with SNARE-associated domain